MFLFYIIWSAFKRGSVNVYALSLIGCAGRQSVQPQLKQGIFHQANSLTYCCLVTDEVDTHAGRRRKVMN